jgi:hypothetical protein
MFNSVEDFHGWLLDQAAALLAHDSEALDWEGLAEQIESLAVRKRREMKERVITLLMHLLELNFEPEQVWRHNSWRSSVIEARQQILSILENSPGVFQGEREDVLARAYNEARKDAARVSGLPLTTFPEESPWPYELVMNEDFFPNVTKAEGHRVTRPIDFLDE